ncbi:lysosome membrane protein 2 [Nephila pilipes]|uniref:Scavenger receptor class B member 1 n=1 Tax=Nephila pilipes TaxID=299642 RepID=A0A8X6IFA3_NEPPI|nr:lysosome membrane protein 2 [Nephila pilipes]
MRYRIALWALIILFVLICSMWLASTHIHSAILKRVLCLEQDHALFELWKDRPHIMYRKFYFFNITNSEAFLSGSRMNVDEVGPITYSLEWLKTGFHWHDTRNMTYRRSESLRFVPEMSCVNQSAVIYTFNASMIENSDPTGSQDLNDSKFLIVKASIRQLMHETGDEPSSFSWLNKIICSKGGFYTIHTGKETNRCLNYIREYNKWKLTDLEDEDVAIIKRSSIELGPSLSLKDIHFKFFKTELCRCMTFIRNVTEEINGLDNIRFEISSHINGFGNLENDLKTACNVSSNNHCCPSNPVVISLPHFFSVESPDVWLPGLNPNETIHNSFVNVEPVTGLTTKFSMRYQFNVKLNGVKYRERVPTGTYPAFWVDDSGTCSKECDDFLLYYVRIPYYVMHSKVSWTIFFILGVWISINIILLLFCRQKNEPEFKEGIPLLSGAALREYLKVNYKELNKSFEDCKFEDEC